MRRDLFKTNSQIEAKPLTEIVINMGKKVAMTAVFLFTAFLAQAQSSFFHQDENGAVRIMYEGKVDGDLFFRVFIDNKEEKVSIIRLVNKHSEVLYDGFYKKKEVNQKIKIVNPDSDGFVFEIKRGGITRPISFEVNLITSYSDVVQIKPLPGKGL